MVYHVALGTEAFTTLLGALERTRIVVHPHVDRQIMMIVELFFTSRNGAENVLSRQMVCHVGLHILLLPEFFCAIFVRASKQLCRSWLAICTFKQLVGSIYIIQQATKTVRGSISDFLSLLCDWIGTNQIHRLFCRLFNIADCID